MGGAIGCAAWPVAAYLLIGPMIWLILGDCFWDGGCGVPQGLNEMAAFIAAMVAAIPICMVLRVFINRLRKRRTD